VQAKHPHLNPSDGPGHDKRGHGSWHEKGSTSDLRRNYARAASAYWTPYDARRPPRQGEGDSRLGRQPGAAVLPSEPAGAVSDAVEANLALVRRVYELSNTGGKAPLEERGVAPDITFHESRRLPPRASTAAWKSGPSSTRWPKWAATNESRCTHSRDDHRAGVARCERQGHQERRSGDNARLSCASLRRRSAA
jgi:hypothetical protein